MRAAAALCVACLLLQNVCCSLDLSESTLAEATQADNECDTSGPSPCALSALQARASQSQSERNGCEKCLRSCIQGEDPDHRGHSTYHECADRCSCQTSALHESAHTSSLYADSTRQGLFGPALASEVGHWFRKATWLKDDLLQLTQYGTEQRLYETENFKKGGAVYSTVQTMAHDRNLYDPVKHVWTAERYLQDLRRRFGGVDQVLIWPGYPNIGADVRSNLDMLEAMPGGLAACFQALKEAQPSLLVQITYMPWDILSNGSGLNDPERYAATMVAAKADGLNLDTMTSFGPFTGGYLPATLYAEAAAKAGLPDLIIEPELGLYADLFLLNVTQQSWLYFLAGCESPCPKKLAFVPRVSLQKWLARRSMPHICARWSKQRSQEILTAYFNAIGFTPWENIWGIWNGINEFDGELLKRSLAVLRHFHLFLSDPSVAWFPFYPLENLTSHGSHVFASKFSGQKKELWLLINAGLLGAGEADWHLRVPAGRSGSTFYDVFTGRQLTPAETQDCLVQSCQGSGSGHHSTAVSVPLEAHGLGAVLHVLPGQQLEPDDKALMAELAQQTARPLGSFSSDWLPFPQQQLVPGPEPSPDSGRGLEDDFDDDVETQARKRPGEVLVKGSPAFEFRVFGAEIEDAFFYANWFPNGTSNPGGDSQTGCDVQYPWERAPTKYHAGHEVSLGDLWVDKYPVTNAAFARFLQESAYVPEDRQNFLRHWGTCPAGASGGCTAPQAIAAQPVVYVSLEDARAYCQHYGKRLPHEWDWQYIAQGGDPLRMYPWGNDWRPDLMPAAQPNATKFAMSDVGQFPGGASKDGVEDLVGLIWHWTDEYADDFTRAAILRGGPAFQPGHSKSFRYQPWYFPGRAPDGPWEKWGDKPTEYGPKSFANLYRLTVHAKYLLMAPSLDRAGTIGFRCVEVA